jgi:hypothetical protein
VAASDAPSWLAEAGTIAAVVVALWLARADGLDIDRPPIERPGGPGCGQLRMCWR